MATLAPMPHETAKPAGHIRFVCISDTHTKTDTLQLPPGDVLIHAGDFTRTGDQDEIEEFNQFLGEQSDKFKHILVIAGNHETTLDRNLRGRQMNEDGSRTQRDENLSLLTNCTYLEDTGASLFGINLHGSPWQPVHYTRGFGLDRGQALLDKWDLIPSDTDILITHGPPLGYGDFTSSGDRVGCSELLQTVRRRVQPRYHVFGHVHDDYGVYSDGVTTFVNAASVDKNYRQVNKPIVFDFKAREGITA